MNTRYSRRANKPSQLKLKEISWISTLKAFYLPLFLNELSLGAVDRTLSPCLFFKLFLPFIYSFLTLVQWDGATSKSCRNWDLKGKQIKILLSRRQKNGGLANNAWRNFIKFHEFYPQELEEMFFYLSVFAGGIILNSDEIFECVVVRLFWKASEIAVIIWWLRIIYFCCRKLWVLNK